MAPTRLIQEVGIEPKPTAVVSEVRAQGQPTAYTFTSVTTSWPW